MSDFNLDEFLTTELGITADELDTAKGLFTEDRAKRLRDGYSRQSDYSRRMDKLKEDERALLARAGEIAEIKDKAERRAAQAEYDAQLAKLELEKARDDYGIPPLEIEKPARPEPKDEPKGFTREEAISALSQSLKVGAHLRKIEKEFGRLFPDRDFDPVAFIERAEANAAKGKDMYATAEEEFKFSEVRQKRSVEEAVKQALADRDAEWQQKLSQQEIPTAPRRDEERSPLLRGKDRAEKADPNRGRAAALAYLRGQGHAV